VSTLVDLTSQSAKHIVDRELCLYLLGWAKSCSILVAEEECNGWAVQRGDIMKGISDESSTVIGLRSLDEVGINYELRA